MKIAILAAANSIHTVRWANGLSELGNEVHVISQHGIKEPFKKSVTLHMFNNYGAIGYFIHVLEIRKLLSELRPDILNAHYASGYGTTARLVDYHPFLLSVWGSDVYDFPYESFLHKWLLQKNLLAADKLASTSHCMAEATRILVPEVSDIAVIPFGVDVEGFPYMAWDSPESKNKVVIGTIKTMLPKYGIDTLISAYALLLKKFQARETFFGVDFELRLIGEGEQLPELRKLAKDLGVDNSVSFVGYISHENVPIELSKLDVFVALSRLDSESFGVAVIEAGAAGRPVVVSDVGGLPEVTLHNQTGFVVERENPQAAADAIERLIVDDKLRHRMGSVARKHVIKEYAWDKCLRHMMQVYEQTIKHDKENDF